MITAIGAVLQGTSQRADVVRFYRDGLELGDPDHWQGEELFLVGDIRLRVTAAGETGVPAPSPSLSLSFIVDDLDGQVAHLKSLGVPFDVEPTADPNGTRVAVCRDPDGNLVTLLSGPRLPGMRRRVQDEDDQPAKAAKGKPAKLAKAKKKR